VKWFLELLKKEAQRTSSHSPLDCNRSRQRVSVE